MAVASLGVDKVHVAALPPKRSSGVNCSCITRNTVSGSIEIRQTERRVGRSDFHVH